MPGLSAEIVEKLTRVRPCSLAQAGRIPGVTPAAISVILLVVTAAIMIGYNRLMERGLFAGVFHR